MGAPRIGFYSIKFHARKLCDFITRFTPLIQRAYPENTVILTLLAAANAACAALIEEIISTETPGV